MAIAVFMPIIFGALVPLLPFKSRSQRNIYIEFTTILTSILVIFILLNRPEGVFTVINFTGNLSISFRLDGLGTVFGAIVATLWPLATLYAFEYMQHEGNDKFFFMFYEMTFGVTLGIAMADDILTMYCFYEMLTLVTLPLIMHTCTREAILASRTYLYYSLGGAAFAFIGMIFILVYGTTGEFVPGGVFTPAILESKGHVLLLVYVLTFIGFSVKTAMFPLGEWLPKAGVAPTPVTALLHAVAVVKAGAFAAMRVTYYSFGAEFLRGSWAQTALLILVIFTIVYGCSRAVKETHIKRRLAYSTMSNLSYILFGVLLMSPIGLLGALAHMISHAVTKICAFFCAGSIMHQTDKHYVHELNGMGRKLPWVFVVFTFSACSLMGVPGLCAFVSKWYLANAAVLNSHPLAPVGIVALLISALLTAIYMMSIVIRAFFPGKDFDYETLNGYHDPSWQMLVPLTIFVVAMIVIGVYSRPLIHALEQLVAFVQ